MNYQQLWGGVHVEVENGKPKECDANEVLSKFYFPLEVRMCWRN
jgi:hypothetical protein